MLTSENEEHSKKVLYGTPGKGKTLLQRKPGVLNEDHLPPPKVQQVKDLNVAKPPGTDQLIKSGIPIPFPTEIPGVAPKRSQTSMAYESWDTKTRRKRTYRWRNFDSRANPKERALLPKLILPNFLSGNDDESEKEASDKESDEEWGGDKKKKGKRGRPGRSLPSGPINVPFLKSLGADFDIVVAANKRSKEEQELKVINFLETFKEIQYIKCSKCTNDYSTKEMLLIHFKAIHVHSGNFPCWLCGKDFSEHHDLNKHIQKNHKKPKFNCSKCVFSSADPKDIKDHKLLEHHDKPKHTPSDKINTTSPPKDSKQKSKRKRTASIQTDKNRNNLSKIEEIDVSEKWANILVKTFDENKVKCSKCTSACINSELLEIHTQYRHQGVKQPKCTMDGCTYTSTYQNITKHVRIVHFDLRPFICKICNFLGNAKNVVVKHLKINHGILGEPKEIKNEKETLKCISCKYHARDSNELDSHNKKAHNNNAVKDEKLKQNNDDKV